MNISKNISEDNQLTSLPMTEKIDQRRGGFMEWLIRRWNILSILVVFVMVFYTPVTASTTQLHIVKYAYDGTTILSETTRTYQWMQANLPVLGDGTTHYYHQGPVFIDNQDPVIEQELRWNPDEDTNVQEKDNGAVKGTNLKDICDLVGGMNAGETVKLKASDGFSRTFAYENVYQYPARQGPMGITWYRDGQYVDSGYADGMKLVFFADTSTNPWGIHAMGNYDWHESAAPEYWYYYASGAEQYPTTTGLSVKYISDVLIYSDDPPLPPFAAFSATPRSGTAPLTVSFTDASTGTGTLSYAWDFKNDGSVDSTLQNPSYQYTAAGTYTVKLTVTNTGGSDSEVKAGYIMVSAAPVAPVAAFSAIPRSGTAPLGVTFTDASSNTPTAWSWSFRNIAGNNTQVVFSTVQNPAHTFGVGSYSIVLDASNTAGHGISTQVTFINVTAPASPSASKIAVYRNGVWIIDTNDNFAWDGAVTDKLISFQNRPITPGDMAVNGDWNGDGKPEVGIYDGSGNWYLDYNGNGIYDGPVIDRTAGFGSAGYKPVVGDWDGTGKDKIGSHKDGFWAIDYNGNYVWDGAVTDRFAGLGQAGDIPVIGDWDGTGTDKIGMEINGFWATDYNGNYVWNGAITDRFAGFGSPGDTPVIGDWDSTGKVKIGSFKDGFWAIDYNGNYAWNGAVTDRFAGFGQTGDVPVVSYWTGI